MYANEGFTHMYVIPYQMEETTITKNNVIFLTYTRHVQHVDQSIMGCFFENL